MGSPITLSTVLGQSDGQAASGSTGPAMGAGGGVSRERVFASKFVLSKSSDNTAALQKAVDEAAARGADLQLPPGTLPVNSGSVVISDSMAIIGNQTTLTTNTDNRILRVGAAGTTSTTDGVLIRDTAFKGNARTRQSNGDPYNSQRMITVNLGENVFIDNCRFENCSLGVIVNGGKNIKVSRCMFDDMVNDGPFSPSADDRSGWGILFSGNPESGAPYRFAHNVHASNNRIVDARRHAIYFSNEIQNGSAIGNRIAYDRLASNSKTARASIELNIGSAGTGNNKGVTLMRNWIDRRGLDNTPTDSRCIQAYQGGNDGRIARSRIVDNHCIDGGIEFQLDRAIVRDNHIDAATEHGIIVKNARNQVRVLDNIVVQPEKDGIRSENTTDELIQGNVIQSAGQSGTGNGITCQNSAGSGGVVSENHVVDPSDQGVRVASRVGTSVLGNTIRDAGAEGIIFIAESNNGQITNNQVQRSNQSGDANTAQIQVTGCEGIFINGNQCRAPNGNASYGVAINADSLGCSVTDNDLKNGGSEAGFGDFGGDTKKNPQNTLDSDFQGLKAGGHPISTTVEEQADPTSKVGDVLLGFGRRLTDKAASDPDENWHIATLPDRSGTNTGDLIVVDLISGQEASYDKFQQRIRLSNRNGFNAYTDYHFGDWGEEPRDAHITAFEKSSGEVEIYLRLPSQGFNSGAVTVREGSAVTSTTRPQIIENPTDVGDSPSGTKLFSSLSQDPQLIVDNDRNVGLGGVTDPGYAADVSGAVHYRDQSSNPDSNGEIQRNGSDVKVYSGGEVVNLSTVVDGSTPTTFSASVAIDDTLIFADQGADPANNGEMQRDGSDVKVYSGGEVRNLSETVDTGTPTTFEEEVTIDDTAGLTIQDGSGSDRAVIQAPSGDGIFSLYDDNENNWVSLANGLSDFIDSDALAVGQSSAGDATLDVNGALKVGSETQPPAAGMIRWTGGDFEGYDGSSWVSLT